MIKLMTKILLTFAIFVAQAAIAGQSPKECATQRAEQMINVVKTTVLFRGRGQLDGIKGLAESNCGKDSLSAEDLEGAFTKIMGVPSEIYFAAIAPFSGPRSSSHLEITICAGKCDHTEEVPDEVRATMGTDFQWAKLLRDDIMSISKCVSASTCDPELIKYYLTGTDYHFVDDGVLVATCIKAGTCDEATFQWTIEKQEFHFFDDALKISQCVKKNQCDSQIFRRVFQKNSFHFFDDAYAASLKD